MDTACGDKTSITIQSSNIANVEENSADRSGLFPATVVLSLCAKTMEALNAVWASR